MCIVAYLYLWKHHKNSNETVTLQLRFLSPSAMFTIFFIGLRFFRNNFIDALSDFINVRLHSSDSQNKNNYALYYFAFFKTQDAMSIASGNKS